MGSFMSKFKTFLVIAGSAFFISIISITMMGDTQYLIGQSLSTAFFIIIFVYIFGIHKPILNYFDNKYYEKRDEINFQKNLRREVQRKRALSQIDNENLHYQNQLRIEYIAQVAKIHLQSNQYLANMYQQAIINNSTQNELTAKK
ncbi:hypothetical protein [Kaistella sp.]|uniref:hypothetical protein n=1 Tax=Kaistella sp. TaxID=2782235 RepID=UPI00359FAB02